MHGAGIIESSKMLEDVFSSCCWLAALGALAWIIESSFMFLWITFGEQQAKEARIKLFIALLNKDMKWYDLQENGIRPFLARIETQIRELQLGVSQPMGFIAYEIFGAIFSLGFGFYFSWRLSLLILVNFPLMAAALWLISKKLGPAVERQNFYLTKASKHAGTSFRAMSTVRAFNGQDHELRQYMHSLKLVTKNYLIQAKVNALQAAVMKFIMVFIYLEGFWFGLQLVINGDYPANVIIAFYTTFAITQALEIILPQQIVIAKAVSASRALSGTIFRIWDDWTAEKSRKTSTEIEAGEIEIKEVSFCYPSNPHNQALKCVNMYIPARETTYVVGKSGSGKTTVGNLIMNYYKSTEGKILINENPIQSFSHDWLRQNITMMDQETLLFNETILRNIAFGCAYPTCIEDIIGAVKTADLESTLDFLPNSLDTSVTMGGKSLSGGQRQRVAIARTRLRDSPVLILDEPVSALDQRSRERVMAEIRRWRQGKTTIIITHDVSHISDDEYVYVMANGSIVEEGYRRNLNENSDSKFSSLLSDALEMPGAAAFGTTNDLPGSSSTSERFDEFLSETSDRQTGIKSNKDTPQMSYIGTDDSKINRMPSNQCVWEDSLHDHTFDNLKLGFDSKPFEASTVDPSVRSPNCLLEVGKANAYLSKLIANPGEKIQDTSPQTTLEEYSTKNVVEPTLGSIKSPNIQKMISLDPSSLYTIFATIWPRLSCKKRIGLVFGLFACFSTAATTPVFAFLISNLMGIYSSPNSRSKEGSQWAILLIVLAFFDGFFTYCSHYYLEQTGQEWITALRKECFSNILKQPKAWMDEESNSPSRLVECLDRNAEEMRNLLGRFLAPILSTGLMLTISIIWSLMISWRLTLAALSCGPLIYAGSLVFNHTTTKYEDEYNHLAENTSSIFSETITNIRVVRSLGLEPYFERKFRAAVASSYSTGLRRSIFSGLTYGVVGDAISFTMTALVAYYGASLIVGQSISILDYFQIINILLFGLGNSFSTISLIPQINASRATATKIIDLANLPSKNRPRTRYAQSFSLFPIIFNDLNFTYPNRSSPTLKIINLKILPNSCTAIIGPSGSGKSTIASLLLALYPPDESPAPSLTFAGISVRRWNLASLRDQIAVVSQDIILFPDTIYANITYGLPKSSPYAGLDCVQDASRQAGIAEFIEGLERGYDTVIGEGGIGLSGGQVQRIAIARALVRHPALLILDEATSALDADSTASICQTIQRLRNNSDNNISIVIITHSAPMIALADHILMMENGRIIERGDFSKFPAMNF
ncbi:hypothetical protein K3495_g8960 [Podosphaera aphanis]|nr:hypothetical protein K3495_g8960 [Podosphaera aphanis]